VVVSRNVTEGSAVIAPWGDMLAYNDGTRELLAADVNVDDLRPHPLGASMQAVTWSMRRPRAYSPLAEPGGGRGPLR
jgi:hypothetical protein